MNEFEDRADIERHHVIERLRIRCFDWRQGKCAGDVYQKIRDVGAHQARDIDGTSDINRGSAPA